MALFMKVFCGVDVTANTDDSSTTTNTTSHSGSKKTVSKTISGSKDTLNVVVVVEKELEERGFHKFSGMWLPLCQRVCERFSFNL
jgi:hypothetical protein